MGLSRLICSKDKLKLEEIDQIRITHYIDDYAFLDGNMIWKEEDVCKLADLLIKIMEIHQETIEALCEAGNFDGLKKLYQAHYVVTQVMGLMPYVQFLCLYLIQIINTILKLNQVMDYGEKL